jgi:hypothetical protein
MTFVPMEFPKCGGRLVKHLDGSVWFCTTVEEIDGECPAYGFEHERGQMPCFLVLTEEELTCPICGAGR